VIILPRCRENIFVVLSFVLKTLDKYLTFISICSKPNKMAEFNNMYAARVSNVAQEMQRRSSKTEYSREFTNVDD
jgi:hypothetical protein